MPQLDPEKYGKLWRNAVDDVEKHQATYTTAQKDYAKAVIKLAAALKTHKVGYLRARETGTKSDKSYKAVDSCKTDVERLGAKLKTARARFEKARDLELGLNEKWFREFD